jgi:hypothetical protein
MEDFIFLTLSAHFLTVIAVFTDGRLPNEFLERLNNDDNLKTICNRRACMICWSVTGGTGSGKTLPMALTMLLDNPADNRITITISPLKSRSSGYSRI